MILQKETQLYRYCLGIGMPDDWSVEYHSPEYHSDEFGEKNQIGALFFYLDEQTARNVLSVAITNAAVRNQQYPQNTITRCETTEDIELLDLTGCHRPINMLNILYDEGIDVLTSDFVRHLDGEEVFDSVRGYHQFIMENAGSKDWVTVCDINNYASKVDQFFRWRVGYTGQLMTDFGNGVHFKRLLCERGFEGYQFNEEKTSPTICIFESDKLTKPCHVII